MWRNPDPKKSYDVIIVGGGGHGLGTAYYLAKEHGIKNIAVIENTRLKQESLDLQRKWDESLKEYLSHSYFRDLF